MYRGTTNVGAAYVKITADGSGINKDIADSIEDADFSELGNRYGKEYAHEAKKFNKDVEKDLNKSVRRMNQAFETNLNLRRGAAKSLSKAFDNGKFGYLGRRLAEDLGVEFNGEFEKAINLGMLDAFQGALDNAIRNGSIDDNAFSKGPFEDLSILVNGPALEDARRRAIQNINSVRKAEEAAAKDSINTEKKRVELIERYNKNLTRLFKKQAEDRAKAEAKAESKMLDDRRFKQFAIEADKALSKIRFHPRVDDKDIREVRERLRKSFERMDDIRVAMLGEISDREKHKLRLELESIKAKVKVDLDEKGLNQSLLTLEKNRSAGKSMGSRIGKILGAGSRNNFLNVFGKSMGGIVDLTAKVTRGASTMGKAFSDGFTKAGESASKFKKIASGFSSMGATASASFARMGSAIAASGPAAAAAIAVVVSALSVLISVVGSLVAIVTSLAATIVSGLVGALTVLGGAITAVVAAGGLLATAFASMNKKQKKYLAESFKPLADQFRGLGQIMLKDMVPAFQQWSNHLQAGLHKTLPLVRQMGPAFADAGRIITAMFSGPGFTNLFSSLAVYLPNITRNLSMALSGFMDGLMGVFAAVTPQVAAFAQHLSNVASRFSQWASSAAGQNSIVDFTKRATESLKSLWGFVEQFTGFLSDVLFSPEAQYAGNTLFDDLANSFRRMRDAVAKAAANGDLKRWFDDGVRFGRALGNTMKTLMGAFSALYNSGVINAISGALETINSTMKPIIWTTEKVIDVFGWLLQVVSGASGPLMAMAGPLGTVANAVIGFGDVVGRVTNSGVINAMLGALEKTNSTMKPIIWTTEKVTDVLGWLLQVVSGAAGPLMAMAGPLGVAANAVIGFGGVVDRVANTIASVVWWAESTAASGLARAGAQAAAAAALAARYSAVHAGKDGAMASRAKAAADAAAKITMPKISVPKISAPKIDYGVPAEPKDKKGKEKKFVNPYASWARSLLEATPSIQKMINDAFKNIGKSITASMRNVAKIIGGSEARAALKEISDSMVSAAKDIVSEAKSRLQQAAQDLLNASNMKEAKRARRAAKKAQQDLRKAIAAEKRAKAAAKVSDAQKVLTEKNVKAIMDGAYVANATLADYAEARERVAAKLEAANQKLADAISLRDTYAESVKSALKSYASILSAQPKIINGISQELEASDITSNLRDRLGKIKKFQDDLRILLSQGLSNDAYKQLVDAGVEGGQAYVDALLKGGPGAITELNDLVGKIDGISDSLGKETANRLYQAGVDAAQGLVDGLEKLASQIDRQALRLGEIVANQIRKALGLKTVPLSSSVGGAGSTAPVSGMPGSKGTWTGEDHRVGAYDSATDRFSSAAAFAAGMQASGAMVSGNQSAPTIGVLNIHTPTEDPYAVAKETMNEITGRL